MVVPPEHEIDIVHACLLGPDPMTGALHDILDALEPVFLTHGRLVVAACGRHVRVLLPKPFDSEQPKACPRCLETIGIQGF